MYHCFAPTRCKDSGVHSDSNYVNSDPSVIKVQEIIIANQMSRVCADVFSHYCWCILILPWTDWYESSLLREAIGWAPGGTFFTKKNGVKCTHN
jgi:hypothetical protein